VVEGRFCLIGETLCWLSHYPYGHPKNVGSDHVLVHGHTHQPKKMKRFKNGTLMLHVGWDAWRRMVSEDDLVALMEESRNE